MIEFDKSFIMAHAVFHRGHAPVSHTIDRYFMNNLCDSVVLVPSPQKIYSDRLLVICFSISANSEMNHIKNKAK